MRSFIGRYLLARKELSSNVFVHKLTAQCLLESHLARFRDFRALAIEDLVCPRFSTAVTQELLSDLAM